MFFSGMFAAPKDKIDCLSVPYSDTWKCFWSDAPIGRMTSFVSALQNWCSLPPLEHEVSVMFLHLLQSSEALPKRLSLHQFVADQVIFGRLRFLSPVCVYFRTTLGIVTLFNFSAHKKHGHVRILKLPQSAMY